MDLGSIDYLVEHLKCGNCNDYLICPPIVLLDDGTSACGNCTPSLTPKNPDGSVVRELTLEHVIRKLSFPCKYKPEGCPERLFFGYSNHEEDACIYRPLMCPTERCPWSGSMFDVIDHFAEDHSAMMTNVLRFKLQVDEDSEESIVVVMDQVPFLAKYSYNAEEAELFLEINCLTLDEVFYKIYMCNNAINDCGVSIEKERALPYISQSCNALTLNLDKYLEVLENPDCVLVNVEIIIEKREVNEAIVVVPPNLLEVPTNGDMEDPSCTYLPLMPVVLEELSQLLI